MPAGTDETDNHKVGAVTEHVMKNSSSKTDNNASTHPLHQGDKAEIRDFQANPGPVIPDNLPGEEGSKEERQAKTKALNQ